MSYINFEQEFEHQNKGKNKFINSLYYFFLIVMVIPLTGFLFKWKSKDLAIFYISRNNFHVMVFLWDLDDRHIWFRNFYIEFILINKIIKIMLLENTTSIYYKRLVELSLSSSSNLFVDKN